MHKLDWFTSKCRNIDCDELNHFDSRSLLAETFPSITVNKTVFPLSHVTVCPSLCNMYAPETWQSLLPYVLAVG